MKRPKRWRYASRVRHITLRRFDMVAHDDDIDRNAIATALRTGVASCQNAFTDPKDRRFHDLCGGGGVCLSGSRRCTNACLARKDSEGGYTRDNVHFVGCQICQLLNTLGYTKVSQLLELLEPAPRHDV